MTAPVFTQSRRAKIVCTLGPASNSDETLRLLIQRGMNVARINLSHGDHASNAAAIARVRRVAQELDAAIGIIADLQGPKIRTGGLDQGPVMLHAGKEMVLTSLMIPGDAARIAIDYPDLHREVEAGARILISDGHIELEVTGVRKGDIHTVILHGGWLRGHQGVNVPNGGSALPSLTEKDVVDLEFALDQAVDYIGQSFVRRADDIRETKRRIARSGVDAQVIAKIEKPQALQNLEEILEVSDGVMVARGDLGVELPPEEVPIWQKRIIARAAHHLVPVITATQMLESMIHEPRPTRAEASDVANAVWDGTDAVMLSGETAIGNYPVEAVTMMDRIVRAAESSYQRRDEDPVQERFDYSFEIARAAGRIARVDPEVRAIAAFTKSGYTARLISKERPPAPVLAMTPDPRVLQRASLWWGVMPLQCRMLDTMDEMVKEVDQAARRTYAVRADDTVIIIGSMPVELSGTTNFLKLHRIGEVT